MVYKNKNKCTNCTNSFSFDIQFTKAYLNIYFCFQVY